MICHDCNRTLTDSEVTFNFGNVPLCKGGCPSRAVNVALRERLRRRWQFATQGIANMPQEGEVYEATMAFIEIFLTQEQLRDTKARTTLGELLKLVEDGVLVQSMVAAQTEIVMEQSARLTRVLKEAQEALA